MRWVTGIVAVACSALAVGAASAQSKTHVHTEWHESKLGLDDCTQKAEAALTKATFVVEGKSSSQSRYGRRGSYVIGIRCIPQKGMTFFLAVGPDWNLGNKHLDTVIANFR